MITPRLHSVIVLLIVLLSTVWQVFAEELPPEFTQAKASYERDVEFALRPIRDRYLLKLESLKRSLGARGDVRVALVVQEEIDRIKNLSAAGGDVARLAGDWKITFNNGRTRHYSISADGTVTWDEENGEKLTPKKARISRQGQHLLLELAEFEIERLSIRLGQLQVEHFWPKNTYPNGTPQMTGRGVLASPK